MWLEVDRHLPSSEVGRVEAASVLDAAGMGAGHGAESSMLMEAAGTVETGGRQGMAAALLAVY